MTNQHPGASLRFFALLFLLPGLAGVIISGWVSTTYFASLPRTPIPAESRIFPRSINGVVVYETETEDRSLTLLEDCSIAVFLVGLGLGVVHLHKWGMAEVLLGNDDQGDLVAERAVDRRRPDLAIRRS